MTTSADTPAESGAYFFTPALKGLVQQLSHLAFFGDGISVVLGPLASGKTALAGELAREFAHAHAISTIHLDEELELAECIQSVSQALGLSAEGGELSGSVGELLAALRHYVQALEQDKKLVILIIDDAQHLDDQAIGALISLLQGRRENSCGLHLVMLSEPGLAARIDALQIVDVAVYDFEMPNFSPSELASFLETREDLAEQLNSAKLQKIWAASRGFPGVALRNLQADQQEFRETDDKAPIFAQIGKNFPFAHLAAVAALVLVLGYIFVEGVDRSPEKPRNTVSLPEKSTSLDEKKAANSLASRGVKEGESAEVAVATAEPAMVRLSNTAGDTADINPPIEVQTPKPIENATLKPAIPERSPNPSATEQSLVDQASSVAGTDGLSLTDDEAFLVAQNPDFFTLQVVAASKKASLESYIDRQSNRASLKMYRGSREGKSWFVVVQGVYSTREMALDALKSLPKEQANAGPWPRRFSLIQQEIETFRRNLKPNM